MTHNGHRHTAEEQEAIRRHEEQVMADDVVEACAYREASRKLLRIFDAALIFIASAENPRVAVWQVAYGIGANCSLEMTQEERGMKLGCGRANVSKGATRFRRSVGMPAPLNAKGEAATASYANARKRQLSNQ